MYSHFTPCSHSHITFSLASGADVVHRYDQRTVYYKMTTQLLKTLAAVFCGKGAGHAHHTRRPIGFLRNDGRSYALVRPKAYLQNGASFKEN